MTTIIYFLYFAMATLTINLTNVYAFFPTSPKFLPHVLPSHPSLQQPRKLPTITKHVGLKFLPKGLHTRIPVLSCIPLSALTAGIILKTHLARTKLLTSPISSVTRVSPLIPRSVDSKVIIDDEKSIDPHKTLIDNKNNLEITSSTTFSNINALDDTHRTKIRSPGYNENMDELEYLSKAANPVDEPEPKFRTEAENTGEGFEYNMQKTNSSTSTKSFENINKTPENWDTQIPIQIWTPTSDNYGSTINSLSNKMNDYLQVMNVSRNFQNPSSDQQTQTRGLRNVLDDFRKSISQSLLFNGKSSPERSSSTPIVGYPNTQSTASQIPNPADRIWNSASNFAGNVAERAFDVADKFVASVLNPDTLINNSQLKPNYENGYPPEFRQEYRPEYSTGYRPDNINSQPSPPMGFSNPPIGFVDKNTDANPGYNNNQQFNGYRPFYNGGYNQPNDPSKPVFNSPPGMKENIPPNFGGDFFKRSNPIELFPNPQFQFSMPRKNRQMPPVRFENLIGQVKGQPLISYEAVQSGNAIIESAINLARYILAAKETSRVHDADNAPTTPKSTVKNSQNESDSNTATTLPDTRTDTPGDGNTETIPTTTTATPTVIDAIDRLINSSKAEINKATKAANGSNALENVINMARNQENVAMTSVPFGAAQIWNSQTPFVSDFVNTAINPAFVGIGRVFQSPYGRSYLGLVPVRPIYPSSNAEDEPPTIAVNPVQFGTTYLNV